MRYQKIESKIWNDEKFVNLAPLEQRTFFYILTSPHNNLSGIYVLKTGYACDDLKCLPKDFQKDLIKLCGEGLILYDKDTQVVGIKNFIKHNPITNPNQKKALLKQLLDLPKTQLIQEFINFNQRTLEGLDKALIKGLTEELKEVLLKPDTDTEADTEEETELNTLASNDKKISFSAQRGEFKNIGSSLEEKWEETYPAINIPQEIKKAEAWLLANPRNRKKNYERFLVNWFSRAQEKAPRPQKLDLDNAEYIYYDKKLYEEAKARGENCRWEPEY